MFGRFHRTHTHTHIGCYLFERENEFAVGFALFLTVTTCLGAGGCAAGGWTDGHRQGRVQRNQGEKDSKEEMRLQHAHEWHGAIRCGIKTWEYDMAGTAEAAGQLRGEAAGA